MINKEYVLRAFPDIAFRMYKEGDEYGIVKLFHEVFGKQITIAEWTWKYRGQGNERVYAVVAEYKNKGIVGHYGGIPVRMYHNGKEIKGLSICDVMIHPKFRGLKNFKTITHMIEEALYNAKFSMVYGFPTEHTLMLPAEKLGLYERVEDVYELLKEPRLHNNTRRFLYKLFPLEFEDERIDKLWNTAKRNLILSVIRDRKYLTWRYKNNPVFSYELWGLRKRCNNRPIGLAVIKRESVDKMLLMDIIFQEGYLIPLIQKIENFAFTSGVKTLSLWLPYIYHVQLQKMGFKIKPAGTTIPCTTHHSFLKKVDIEGQFFYTMGDADYL